MALSEDIESVGRRLDAFAATYHCHHVAAEDPDDGGVPPAMFAGDVDEDGWVAWKVLPSTLREPDIAALEAQYGIELPPLFRAYLLARFHLFDQVDSRVHGQLVFMTDTPSNRPLGPLRSLLDAWAPLIDAGFVPFAQWGDAWGPMCFDTQRRGADGDCPVVWFDHGEVHFPVAEGYEPRELVVDWAKPLYDSFADFLDDVLGP